MVRASSDRPAIHICHVGAVAPGLDLWVEIGAEEEGVPTRVVDAVSDSDVVAAAYGAARSSRVDIGVAISPDCVVLHETHMPPEKPVLTFSLGTDPRQICRLMGGNAARMVARLPLRFEEDLFEQDVVSLNRETKKTSEQSYQNSTGEVVSSEENVLSDHDVKRIAALVTSIIRERGKTWP
jgi:Dehydratase medium subunit.